MSIKSYSYIRRNLEDAVEAVYSLDEPSFESFLSYFSQGPMPPTLPTAEKANILASLQCYLSTELDHDLGDIQATHLLDYILKEVAPFAYNQGIEDAKTFLTSKLEDLPGTCFAEPLTYWHTPPPAPAKSAASHEGAASAPTSVDLRYSTVPGIGVSRESPATRPS